MMEIEEDMILVGFHQEVQKARDKAWHDKNIKRKSFKEGDLVLVYEVNPVTEGGVVQLKYLGGTKLIGMINGIQMKLYRDIQPPNT
jgi:hypothetical protein